VSILNPLADLVAWVIIHLHTWLGSLFGPDSGLAWGLSIVILVVLIRICLIPLFVKQVHAQRKMAQHAPQLAELRKKYKNDKARLNEETMKFYKENGVNPLAGCLPMIPQMVIFFSLFYVLRAIAEWSPAHYVHGKLVAATVPKYGLSVPLLESARKATIFGVHLSDKLLLPHTPGMGLVPSLVAAVTVALSATTTFLTVRQTSKRGLMQTNVDPDNPMAGMQKYMMYIVPFFSLTGLYWQYGLVMYWLTTNVWTLGQQFFMFRNWTIEPAQTVATATGGAYRAARSAMRPESGTASGTASGAAKTATSAAKVPSAGTRAPSAAAKSTTNSAKTTASGTRTASAAKPAPPAGAANGRPASAAPRAKTASESAATSTATGRVRTGSASRDAAANTSGPPNGQNGAVKRSLLRLGRQKEEPVAEPEVPATKVVRQQPVRQAKSKRSGKR
jgi:YidC/Oxa1 family membrane protein insertase